MRTTLTTHLQRLGYWPVLVLMAIAYVACAATPDLDPSPLAFIAMLSSVALTLWIARLRRSLLLVCWAVIAAAGVAVILVKALGLTGFPLDVALSVAAILACAIAPTAIITHQVRLRRPGLQNLLAAVTAYVTVGMLFTFVYVFASLVTGQLFLVTAIASMVVARTTARPESTGEAE